MLLIGFLYCGNNGRGGRGSSHQEDAPITEPKEILELLRVGGGRRRPGQGALTVARLAIWLRDAEERRRRRFFRCSKVAFCNFV